MQSVPGACRSFALIDETCTTYSNDSVGPTSDVTIAYLCLLASQQSSPLACPHTQELDGQCSVCPVAGQVLQPRNVQGLEWAQTPGVVGANRLLFVSQPWCLMWSVVQLSGFGGPCCAVWCRVVPCGAVLCCAVLCRAVVRAGPCHAML
jgi:hypothetical protein